MMKKTLLTKLITLQVVLLLVSFFVIGVFANVKDGALLATTTWVLISMYSIVTISFFVLSVSKPINLIVNEMKLILVGKNYKKIFTKKTDETAVLAHFFNEVTRALENVSVDLKKNKRLASELSIAQKIQKDLLPKSNPSVPGLNIISKTKPAAEIGGDSFDFITRGNNTYFFIGDVTGHGIPAGLVMIMVDTLINTFMDLHDDIYDIIVQTNKYLFPKIQSTVFMTMVLFQWEHTKQELSYIGAGHENIMHFKSSSNEINIFKSGGIALGMTEDISKIVKKQKLDFKPGDYLILYSDGITEATNIKGEQFGLDRIKQLVESTVLQKPESKILFRNISNTLAKFIEGTSQKDDMSLMVINHTGDVKSTSVESTEWSMDNNKGLIDIESHEIHESGLKEK